MTEQKYSQKFLKTLERINRPELESFTLGLCRDLENKERALNCLQEGLLLADSDGIIVFVNETFLLQFQESEKNIKGKPLQSVLERFDLNSEDFLNNLLRDHQTISLDLVVDKPLQAWYRLTATPFADETNRLAGASVTFNDISEIKQEDQKRVFKEKWNTLIPLAAGLAHEIGNPLNALDIHMQLAEREIKDLPAEKKTKVQKFLNVAKEEIKRLDRIVSHFLVAVRPLKGTFKLKDVNHILDSALDFMAPEASLAKVSVERRFQTNLPETLVDEDQLKQAFFNLIKNAIQAMPKGGLLKAQTELKNQLIRIVLSDSGEGIKKEELSHIFEPYYSSKDSGSGLGLVAVKRILNEHGGSVAVRSHPGKGTEFELSLPLSTGKQPLMIDRKPKPKTKQKRKPNK